jgi:hypothetical protein
MTTDRVAMNAAIDGADWPTAAFALMSSDSSLLYSRPVQERLAAIGFEQLACTPTDQALIRRLADIETKEFSS